MTKKSFLVCLLACTGTLFAQQGSVPKGVPNLNHVFVIMMENHGYAQILNNPNAPYINSYAQSANLATNYFALLRRGAPELDQLPRSGWRVEFRSARRQLARLA